MRLSNIEKEIGEIHKKILQVPEEIRFEVEAGKGFATDEQVQRMTKQRIGEYKAELDSLERQRQFIIDNRNSIFWKVIWNGIVPIVVSFITAYLVTAYIK